MNEKMREAVGVVAEHTVQLLLLLQCTHSALLSTGEGESRGSGGGAEVVAVVVSVVANKYERAPTSSSSSNERKVQMRWWIERQMRCNEKCIQWTVAVASDQIRSELLEEVLLLSNLSNLSTTTNCQHADSICSRE